MKDFPRNLPNGCGLLPVVLTFSAMAWAQIPNAPPVPTCRWDSVNPAQSTCRFKQQISGTPTSVAGNRVILFNRSTTGNHPLDLERQSLMRLSQRYGFTATVSQDPTVFTAANLANTKVVIFSNGDGDVVPAGSNRTTLENFQLQSGWGAIWIHHACAFITTGWPYGQNSCVQQYYNHNPSGTVRRMVVDSQPGHGTNNPQTEFLLRAPFPGAWDANRGISMSDEWFSFRAPARNTAGVNVLFNYDENSGAANPSMGGTLNHNMIWTHMMGNGITIYNSWGHDNNMYTGYGNFGDTLLWRFIRYAAKDWCNVADSACAPVTVFKVETRRVDAKKSGTAITISITQSGMYAVSIFTLIGRKIFVSSAVSGPGKVEIPGLRQGAYIVQVASGAGRQSRKIMVY